MREQNYANDGECNTEEEPLSGFLKTYVGEQIQHAIERHYESEHKRKKWRNSFRRASPITQASLILTAIIAAATIAYSITAWRTLSAMKRISSDTSQQTGQLLDAAKQMKQAAWESKGATQGIEGNLIIAVSKLQGQVDQMIRVGKAAASSANTAQETLDVQNRPWLSAEVETWDDPMHDGDLRFDREENLSITFTVAGKNFGKSIAQDIHIYAKLFTSRAGNPWLQIPKWQSQVCDHPKIIYVRPGVPFFQGFDRFPNQTYSQGVGTEITAVEVGKESSFYSDDPSHTRFIDNLYLVGCVDYRFSFSKERHQTRFAYQITRKP